MLKKIMILKKSVLLYAADGFFYILRAAVWENPSLAIGQSCGYDKISVIFGNGNGKEHQHYGSS
ncbi:hypothetical protein [Paenibacillus polymyxa]|uniref:hypothetical protein n=1 Tax=Paenibacillus polymyxa TaxID=1406 RepID=UPI00237999CB|nr:hypothetical protein [Paenibacillus polymyxa]WDM21721.1 hypothetical protein J4I02_22860 [Paenibacillus polymyxa]